MLIDVRDLRKEYMTYRRGSSLKETVQSLFRREKVIVKAVDGISFSIGEGEIVGMLGRNGAGKSTTIKMLSGILTPTAGGVTVMGYTPFRQRTKYVGNIGAVFGQKSQLVWDIPPLDSFLMNKAIYAIPTTEYKQTLDKLVTLLQAGEIISRPTRVLSLGERMKCEFIMAMLHNPKVVFLDEPTIGLDVIAKDSIRSFVGEMNRAGTTFILTTHDLGDIESLARRVIIIDGGKLIFDGALAALRHHLGNKKNITVAAKSRPRPEDFALPGIEPGEFGETVSLTVDLDVLPMNEFLNLLNARCELVDLTIGETPIEDIVRRIYKNR